MRASLVRDSITNLALPHLEPHHRLVARHLVGGRLPGYGRLLAAVLQTLRANISLMRLRQRKHNKLAAQQHRHTAAVRLPMVSRAKRQLSHATEMLRVADSNAALRERTIDADMKELQSLPDVAYLFHHGHRVAHELEAGKEPGNVFQVGLLLHADHACRELAPLPGVGFRTCYALTPGHSYIHAGL